MLQTTDDVKLSGIENFNANPDLMDQNLLDNFKNQVAILHKGFIVHVTDCKACSESTNFHTLEITLQSIINNMPIFGDVKLKVTKQSAVKLKRMLDNVTKDCFAEEKIIPIKKQKY